MIGTTVTGQRKFLFLLLILFFPHCLFGIVDPCGGAHPVSQLVIHNGEYRVNDWPWVQPAKTNTTPQAFSCLSFEFFKRIADSRQLSCDDPDHLSSVASDDGRAGYSLYRWALEVNNINLNVFLDGDDSLGSSVFSIHGDSLRSSCCKARRYAEFGRNGLSFPGYSAEWVPDYRRITPDLYIPDAS